MHIEQSKLERFTPLSIQAIQCPVDQPIITFHNDREPVLRIMRDGRVEFGPAMTPDEASRAFWAQVAKHYRGFRESCVAAETAFTENMRKAGLL